MRAKRRNALVQRLKEPSTYAGLAVLFGAFNIGGITPEGWEAIFTACTTLAAAIAVALPEKGAKV